MNVKASKILKNVAKPIKTLDKLVQGGGGGGGVPDDLDDQVDPMQHSERENLSAWHRDGVSVWDVYDLVEVIGQGHMGEVYKVRRKKEVRGVHNSTTRGRQAEKQSSESSDDRIFQGGRKERSKSPFQKKKKKGEKIKIGKLELKKLDVAKTKSKGKGGGVDAEHRRPEPQVVPVKQPQSVPGPRKSILKESKFTASGSDLSKLEEEEEEEEEGDGGEGNDHSDASDHDASPNGAAEVSGDGGGTMPPPPPLHDGADADADADDDENEEDKALYMKKWEERLKGAKEERLKLLEKMEASGGMLDFSERSAYASSTSGLPSSNSVYTSTDTLPQSTGHTERTVDGDAPPSPTTPRTPPRNRKTIRFQRLYACKTVLTSHVKKGYLDQLLNEISIMKSLDHPFILQLYEVYQVKRSLWLVTELCTGGDLTSRKLNEPQATLVLEQVLRALAYLHRNGICHRDIKLENILYESGSKEASVRLIDFGLSQAFDRAAEKSRRAVGTAYTMSPEIAGGDGKYTYKTDMWSLGVVAWILLAGDAPFVKGADDLKDKAKLDKLLNARYSFGVTWKGRGISQYGYDFVRKSLKRRPEDRWTAKEALEFVQNTWIPKLEGDYEGKEEARKLQKSVSSKKRLGEAVDIDVEDVNRFCNYGRLKKTILMTMARTIERSEVDRLREIFLTVDTEDAGTISIVELKKSLSKLNSSMDDSDIEKIFEGIDQDQSGQIHWAEFLAALSESHGLITMDRLAAVFDRLDTEGKGYISHENLKVILGKDYDKDVVEGMIKEADFKNNGQIDYEEFLQLMFANPESGDVAVGSINDSRKVVASLTHGSS